MAPVMVERKLSNNQHGIRPSKIFIDILRYVTSRPQLSRYVPINATITPNKG